MKIAFKMSNVLQKDVHTSNLNNLSSFQQICTLASNVSTTIIKDGTWSAATETPPGTSSYVNPESLTSNSSNTSTTTASGTDPDIDCFNRGGKHHFNKCHHPKDPEHIRQAHLKHCTNV